MPWPTACPSSRGDPLEDALVGCRPAALLRVTCTGPRRRRRQPRPPPPAHVSERPPITNACPSRLACLPSPAAQPCLGPDPASPDLGQPCQLPLSQMIAFTRIQAGCTALQACLGIVTARVKGAVGTEHNHWHGQTSGKGHAFVGSGGSAAVASSLHQLHSPWASSAAHGSLMRRYSEVGVSRTPSSPAVASSTCVTAHGLAGFTPV